MKTTDNQVAIITGAAKRLGAAIARKLHQHHFNVLIHYNHSDNAAMALADELNQTRADSAIVFQCDLLNTKALPNIIKAAFDKWQRIDALVNNASSFYPTPIGSIDATCWDDLIASNLKAPLFLSQAAAPFLKITQGCIVNMVDIHAEKPLKEYIVYSIAKAGLVAQTKSLARELAPEVRVNAIAPGPILWDESATNAQKKSILGKTPLARQGTTAEIADAVLFLVQNASFTTGQILKVDGGKSLA